MTSDRSYPISAFRLAASILICSTVHAQIVINEVVKEERTAGSGAVEPDVREFVELYNAGSTAVDLSGWSVGVYDLLTGAAGATDTIPSGSIDPGGYYVIGGAEVPNVNFSPVSSDLYPDNTAQLLELRDSSSALVDAVGYEIFRSGLDLATSDQLAEIGSGYQGQLISTNANAPNTRTSWGRYRDGVDTNRNGLDFGILPLTPGESNNLPINSSHSVPDVDGLAINSPLSDEYFASFLMPRVVDPTVASGVNPRPVPASPQGGNAIVAWDETGGGNTAYSKELVNSYDLYAYFDTTPLGVAIETEDEEWESHTYGIGSADPFFGNPDPTGGIFVPDTVTQNASTGIGWVYQQYENFADSSADFSRLVLVDFGDGGNSTPEAGEWTVIETIDMSTVASGWYRLSMDYEPATGEVVARFGDDTYTFTSSTDLAGTFFVGYREGITSQGERFDKLNPPIYDLFVEQIGEPGDFDGDGTVGPEDYALWRDTYGEAVEVGQGADGNGDGIINAADYTVWRDSLISASAFAAGVIRATTAVPEPTSLVMVGVILACVVACDRRWLLMSVCPNITPGLPSQRVGSDTVHSQIGCPQT